MSFDTDIDDVERSLQEKYDDETSVETANIEYYRENREQIQEQYGGEFIAIVEGEVVLSSSPPENSSIAQRFIQELEDICGPEAVDTAYITYVPPA